MKNFFFFLIFCPIRSKEVIICCNAFYTSAGKDENLDPFRGKIFPYKGSTVREIVTDLPRRSKPAALSVVSPGPLSGSGRSAGSGQKARSPKKSWCPVLGGQENVKTEGGSFQFDKP